MRPIHPYCRGLGCTASRKKWKAMSRPFEFKNPLDGAVPPLDRDGKNPFSDGEPVPGEVSDNLYATTSSDTGCQQPDYVTTYAHHGPLLLRLAIIGVMICLAATIAGLLWQSLLLLIAVANGVLVTAVAIKAGYDLSAIRAGAMSVEGRGRTRAALVLSLAATFLTVAAVLAAFFLE